MAIERFLIVDDNDAHTLFFSVVLNDLGAKSVFTARTGEEALDTAKRESVQFIIAGWEIAPMPGTVLVQRFRSTARKKHTPYLIYSRRMAPEDLALSRELGLGNVLSWPLDKAAAKAAIKALLDAEAQITPEELRLRKIEAYLGEGKPNEALKLIDAKMLKKGPYYVRSQTSLGAVWLATGQLKKAEDCLKLALTEAPTDCEASNVLACVYSKSGRHEEALAILQKLVDHSPKNITTLLNLGGAYVDADRHQDAQKVFQTVSTLDPDSQSLKDAKGKLAFKEGDLPLAAQLLAETQNGDAIARYFNNLAIALAHGGKFDKAIDTYENAIKLLVTKARLSSLHYNLGLACAKKGDLTRAFRELAASYKGDPNFEKAYVALARVSKQIKAAGQTYDVVLAREIATLRKSIKAAAPDAGKADGKTAA